VITQERLKELFDYKDGILLVREGKPRKITPITKHHRYMRIRADGVVYFLHRLIFLFHKGYLSKVIDHIDNDRNNNRIENLREATQQQNCLNRVTHKNNKSGAKNVHFDKGVKKWCVGLYIKGKRKVIGYFEDFELAELVAIEARNKFFGSFARS
jgi:hypothetical protein